MANSSISADIKAANSKLAVSRRRKEEEEMILQIGKRKIRDVAKEERTRVTRARTPKWKITTNFEWPSPMVDRPKTTGGSTSFHFSYTSISKQSGPTVDGKPIGGSGRESMPGLDHSKYIEREGAAEQSRGINHAQYLERPGAVETIDPSAIIAEGIERTHAAVVNETPMDNEIGMLGLEVETPGIRSVFSNISDDQFEREEYWRAVHRAEREPKQHSLILDPTVNPTWWAQLPLAEHVDKGFAEHAAQIMNQKLAWDRENKAAQAEGRTIKPYFAAPYPASAEKLGKLMQALMQVPGWNELDSPFRFQSGRGGRVQIRFVAELPHELSAEDRALIVQNFCDHLGSIEKAEDGRARGMMYTAVIHAPDAHNDRRNFHLHIIAHDRPAKWLEDHGMWDFEITETYQDPGSRKDRIRYPHRQGKVEQISQSESRTGKPGSGRDFVPTLRKEFARITNTVLEARGIERRYDPRRYADMGIERTPTEHLGTQLAALESIGVATTTGKANAIAIWNDAEAAIENRAKAADGNNKERQLQIQELLASAARTSSASPAIAELRRLAATRATIIDGLAEDRRGLMTFDHMEARAKSRALRTRQTCIQMINDIRTGVASRSTSKQNDQIAKRWREAQAHLEQIDRDLAPHRGPIAAAAADVLRREARLAEIDAAIAPLAASIERSIGSAPSAISQPSVPSPARPATPVAEQPVRPPMSTEPVPIAPVTTSPAIDTPTDTRPSEPASVEPAESPTRIVVETPTQTSNTPEPSAEDQTTTTAPESVPLAPISMDGVPIVEPSLPPEQTSATSDQTVPGDLAPLRDPPSPTPMLDPSVTPTVDIDTGAEAAATSPADATRNPASETTTAEPEAPAASPAATAPTAPMAAPVDAAPVWAEPTDGRRRKEDATLFPVEESKPPIKAGTKQAEHAEWNELINRISRERLMILVEQRGSRTRLVVPSLSEDETALLSGARFAVRTAARLASIHTNQRNEVTRLVRWLSDAGRDPERLSIQGRGARLVAAPPGVIKLMKDWRTHPEVVATLRAEAARREEERKKPQGRTGAPAAPAPKDEDVERQERIARARKIYPDPKDAATRQVREFVTLLRDGAGREQLQAAADEIAKEPAAREDVNRHRIELAAVYNELRNDDMLRAERERAERSRRGGR